MQNLSLKNIPNSVIIGAGVQTVADFGMWHNEVALPVFRLMSVDVKNGKVSKEWCPNDIKTHSRKQFMKFFAWVLDADRNFNYIRKNLDAYKKLGLKNIKLEQIVKDVLRFRNKYLDCIDDFVSQYEISNDKTVSSFYVTLDKKSVKSNSFENSLYKRFDLDIQFNQEDLSSDLAKNVRLSASKIYALNRVRNEYSKSNKIITIKI